jgi:hypothetical protein
VIHVPLDRKRTQFLRLPSSATSRSLRVSDWSTALEKGAFSFRIASGASFVLKADQLGIPRGHFIDRLGTALKIEREALFLPAEERAGRLLLNCPALKAKSLVSLKPMFGVF